MSHLVAIVGKAHAGKTTLAKAMFTEGYQRISFAHPVKEISAIMLSVMKNYVYDKLYPNSFAGHHLDLQDVENMKGDPAIRKLLQLVGTELGREWHGPDTIWIDMLRVELDKRRKIYTDDEFLMVCDDCRFPNEAEALKEMGFTIIKLVRDENERKRSILHSLRKEHPDWDATRLAKSFEEIMSHPSETSVDLIVPDITMDSISVEQLKAEAKYMPINKVRG